MKGDFSRSTFNPLKHYNSVRMQQGRVQLDADWNEQVDILLHLITTQLKDLLGLGGTTVTNPGFAITLDESESQPLDEGQGDLLDEDETGQPQDTTQPARIMPDFKIGAGHYYVEGILCENKAVVTFSQQPDYPAAATLAKKPVEHDQYLVYLDVWQRHITANEDPAIREIALGGTDTTTRVKTVWQVKLFPLSVDLVDYQGSPDDGGLSSLPEWQEFVEQNSNRGRLRARWDKDKGAFMENHLYRVEIHTAADGQATFKWSRENGSVVFPIIDISLHSTQEDSEIILEAKVENLERDIYQLNENDWVEFVDDVTQLNGHPLPLCQVKELDRPNARVTLKAEKDKIDQIRNEIGARELHHPLLRRWEDDIKTVILSEDTVGDQSQGWLNLEYGIQVAFSDLENCQADDYWLIPARTRLEDGIEWSQKDGQSFAQAPHGIVHHYAPLALIQFRGEGWCVILDEAARFATLPQVGALFDRVDASLDQVDVRLNELVDSLAGLDDRVGVLEELQADFQASIVQYFQIADEIDTGHVVSVIPLDPSDELGSELRVRLTSADNESDKRLVVGVVIDILDDEESCRVMLYGRAKCRVVGEIEPGDLLVPSKKPGYAQKAGRFSWPGTIIGKALSTIRFDEEVMEQIDEGIRLAQIDMSERTGTVDMIVTLR